MLRRGRTRARRSGLRMPAVDGYRAAGAAAGKAAGRLGEGDGG